MKGLGGTPLKPSLVEWKLNIGDMIFPVRALETFLGGMETDVQPPDVDRIGQSLKPSLVEWKLPLMDSRLPVVPVP